MKSLELYIQKNIDTPESSPYYNECFCNITLDYLGSRGEFSKEDIEYLNIRGYQVEDFIDEE